MYLFCRKTGATVCRLPTHTVMTVEGADTDTSAYLTSGLVRRILPKLTDFNEIHEIFNHSSAR